MKPRPMHSRDDLIQQIRPYVPTRACDRAVGEGRVEVFGGFAPPEGFPYFLLQVTSYFGKQWRLGLEVREAENRLVPLSVETVDWSIWDGRTGGRSLKDGDDPVRYARYRAHAKRRKRYGTAQANQAQ